MDDPPKPPRTRATDHFLALLGHEMRNPLGALRNALDLIERHPEGDVRRRQLKIARRQVEDLTRLVDDLLDASRLDSGKLQLKPEPLDLRLEIFRLVEMWRPELQAAGLELSFEAPQPVETVAEAPVAVEVDRTRLRQMVGNLLSNARKFTESGGRITVRLRTDEDTARLDVEDTGYGIEAEDIERLFGAFEQSEQARRLMTGGLGLGLPIVRGLARAHGGELTARSDGPGRGSCFTLTLPLTEAEVPPWASETGAMYVAALGGPSPPPSPSRVRPVDPADGLDPFLGGPVGEPVDASEGVNAPETGGGSDPQAAGILLIDDHRASAEGLAELLRLEGYRVTVIDDGRAAEETFESVRPDAVVCDLGLPVVDGYEVARRLIRRAGERKPLLVALSGFVDSASRKRAKNAGFSVHLSKPVDLDQLLEVLSASPAVEHGGEAENIL